MAQKDGPRKTRHSDMSMISMVDCSEHGKQPSIAIGCNGEIQCAKCFGNPKETKFRYVHFVRLDFKSKTMVWACRDNLNEDQIGIVRWYPPWDQYCYFPSSAALSILSQKTLDDISKFLKKKNKKDH